MNNITAVKLTSLQKSLYVSPFRMLFKQNGTLKSWDLIKTHHSVAIIVFNTSRNVLVCVKQFRPGVYLNNIPEKDRVEDIDSTKYPGELGITLEFCAGIVDKDLSLQEIACEEVYEECGYKISPEMLEKVTVLRSAVGVSGDPITLFYVEVVDSLKVGKGGGLEEEGEFIEVVDLSLQDANKLLDSDSNVNCPSEFLFGLLWFFKNKCTRV